MSHDSRWIRSVIAQHEQRQCPQEPNPAAPSGQWQRKIRRFILVTGFYAVESKITPLFQNQIALLLAYNNYINTGEHSAMNTEELTLTSIDGGLMQLTINRPPANALSGALIAELMSTFSRLAQQDLPPGIVLTGAGERFFCAGGDINEVADHELAISRMQDFHELLCQIEQYPRPIVCAVRGYAVGAGFEIVLHSDYVVTASHSRFGFPEINHGLLPAAKGMRHAVAILGYRAARSLLFSGVPLSAENALSAGAVHEIAKDGDVLDRAVTKCRDLSAKDARLYAAIKRTLRQNSPVTDAELLRMTLSDLNEYLGDSKSADARSHFLTRNKKASL
jgi:enoyl-CoA hydratase/carnithine racemase